MNKEIPALLAERISQLGFTEAANLLLTQIAKLQGRIENLEYGLREIITTGKDWDWGENFWAVKIAKEALNIEQGAQASDTTKSNSSNAFDNLKTLIQSEIDYWQSMIIKEVPGITSQATDYMAAYTQVLKWMDGK